MEASTADTHGVMELDPEEVPVADADWDSFRATMEAELPTELDNDLSKIDWLLGKLRKIRDLVEENEHTARCAIRLQENHLAGENAKLGREDAHFRRWIAILMPPNAEEARKAYGKLSRSLINGDIGFKKDPDTIVIDDAEAALTYAEANGLEIKEKTTRSVAVATLKDHMKATGALDGDGWRHVEGISHVFVKPAK